MSQLSAIEILEKAYQNKKEIHKDDKEDRGFWEKLANFFNPFKCGYN